MAWPTRSPFPLPAGIDLLAKVVNYDRNFRARAGARARIVLMVKPGDVDSLRTATQMMAALSQIDKVGGLPHDDVLESYQGPGGLWPTFAAASTSRL